jgi:hypothetical protein
MFKIILDGTFPNGCDAVALQRQFPIRLDIANYVIRKLIIPEFRIAFRAARKLAAMLVPKAPVDKNDRTILEDKQIRRPRQIAAVQPVTKSITEQRPTHQDFGLCVFRMDRLHHLRAVHRNPFFVTAFHFCRLSPRIYSGVGIFIRRYFWQLRFATENRFRELVRTRSQLATASVAKQFCSDIFGSHAFAKFGDSLEVPVATARKTDVADFVAIAGELDGRGACAFRFESFFHKNLLDEPFLQQCRTFLHAIIITFFFFAIRFICNSTGTVK